MSDDEEETSRAAIHEEFEDDEEPISATQGHVHVTLGSVKKMQGFTPMTPEEHQEGNPLRSARPADYLEKKVALVSALLASVVRALTGTTQNEGHRSIAPGRDEAGQQEEQQRGGCHGGDENHSEPTWPWTSGTSRRIAKTKRMTCQS
ncbi:hypothetical protein CYMTET_39319 [Cymbomonas tetramitiformis]|uniref:Uncharacterized protein n=1 Tax=Cymbomonas tetramitiformis TaxID=36881 RepID=A0AAE0CCJ0_9CHLO|nr:hypothetical protein CYMTET_39319 [Cymbomonas tetramitiformis]